MTDDEASCGSRRPQSASVGTVGAVVHFLPNVEAFPKRVPVTATVAPDAIHLVRRLWSKAHQALDRSCFGDIMSLAQALVAPPVHALWFVGK